MREKMEWAADAGHRMYTDVAALRLTEERQTWRKLSSVHIILCSLVSDYNCAQDCETGEGGGHGTTGREGQ